MNKNKTFLFAMGIMWCISGCQTLPNSERAATQVMKQNDIPINVINSVISGSEIDSSYFDELASSPSEDVRFLVASNKFISKLLKEKFERDPSVYVRSGLACNTKIDTQMMRRMATEKSWEITSNLVKNPSAPEWLLLLIYKQSSENEQSLLLLSYSKNPNTPEKIRQVIRTSNNLPAKENLAHMENEINPQPSHSLDATVRKP